MKSIVYKRNNFLPNKVIKGFKDLPASIVSDVMNKMNAMDASIKAVSKKAKFVGVALTVQTMVGDNIMSHIALEEATAGDVIVIDARGHIDTSVWGYVQTSAAIKKGVEAVVINGAIRDGYENAQSNLPIFCKGITPAGPHKGWGGYINVPISCAGLCVHPGDIVLGDHDGVVVVPYYWAGQVLKESKQRLRLEEKWMTRIKKGATSVKAVGLESQVAHLKVEKKQKSYCED